MHLGFATGLAAEWCGCYNSAAGLRVDRVNVMIRTGTVAIFLALGGVFLLPGQVAWAEPATSTSEVKVAQAENEIAPPVRRARRPTTRLRVYPNYEPDDIYPHYDPGPNAVRVCTATYVQEFRPSGTVIVPRMNCHWRRG
jgi:hypothetical protein